MKILKEKRGGKLPDISLGNDFSETPKSQAKKAKYQQVGVIVTGRKWWLTELGAGGTGEVLVRV